MSNPMVVEPSLWTNRSFILLWIGKLTSSFGDRITYLTITWWVLQTLGRPELLGVVMVAATLPLVLISPLSGIIADRVSRKRILVLADVGRGLLLLFAALLMLLGRFGLGWIVGGTIISSILTALFNPAASALIPTLVPKGRLVQANSMIQVNLNLTGLVGPAVGGMLLAVIGVRGCFVVVGIAYLLSALSELFIVEPKTEAPPPRTVVGDLKDTLSYLASQPVLLSMAVTLSVLNFFGAPMGSILLPTAVTVIMGLGAVELGLVMAASSLGVVLCSLSLSVWGGRMRRHAYWLVGGIVVSGVMFMLMGGLIAGFGSEPWAIYALLGICLAVGMGSSVAQVNISSHFQRAVPNERRGRTFGVLTTLSHSLQPPAMAFAALMLGLVSTPVLMAICGVCFVVAALQLLLVPGFRKI